MKFTHSELFIIIRPHLWYIVCPVFIWLHSTH